MFFVFYLPISKRIISRTVLFFFTFIVGQIKSKKAYLLENMYFIWYFNKI